MIAAMLDVAEWVRVHLFGSGTSDEEIDRYLVLGGYVFLVVTFAISFLIPAPYGRYADKAPRLLASIKLDPTKSNRLPTTTQTW